MNQRERSKLDSMPNEERVSLCEALDRVLNKGVVVVGEVVISVADVDLIYLGLQLVLTSVETAGKMRATGESRLVRETEAAQR